MKLNNKGPLRVEFDEDFETAEVVPVVKNDCERLETRIGDKTKSHGVVAVCLIKAGLYAYFAGKNPFYPDLMHGLKFSEVHDYILYNYKNYVFTTLGEMSLYTGVVYVHDNEHMTVRSMTYPVIRKTEHVGWDDHTRWNLPGSEGIYPHTKGVVGLIDYVVEKRDGLYFESYVLNCDYDSYSLCTYGGKWSSLTEKISMSGEMCGDKLYLQVGYELRNLPPSIKIDGHYFDIKKPERVVPQVVQPKGIEGVIVGVSGVEYKIKNVNSVELEVRKGKVHYGKNGGVVNVPIPEGTKDGVIECGYDHVKGKYSYIKERTDKSYGQSDASCCAIVASLRVVDFVSEFQEVKHQHLGNVVDVLPSKEIQKLIIEGAISYGGVINREKAQIYVNSRKRFVTDAQMKSGFSKLGIGLNGMKRVNVANYQHTLSYVPGYASRYEIWNFSRTSMVRLSPLDFCIACANVTGKRVNMSKVMGLVSTNDLMYINNTISSKIYNCALLDDKLSKSYTPPIMIMSNDDLSSLIVNYFNHNYGKFIHEDVITDFCKGNFDSDELYIFNLVKCIVFQLGGAHSFKDPNVWRMILGLPQIREKIKCISDRMEVYGCIGDHEKEHICSNGVPWKPEGFNSVDLKSLREFISLLTDEFIDMYTLYKSLIEIGCKIPENDVRSYVFKLEKDGELEKRECDGVMQWRKTLHGFADLEK